VLEKYAGKLTVGRVQGAKPSSQPAWRELSPVPYAEPPHARPGNASPYYKPSHLAFRLAVRALLDEHLRPWAERAEGTGEYPPKELFRKLGEEGVLAAVNGPGPHLAIPPRLPGGVKPSEFDMWYLTILHEEFGRLGTPGAADAIIAGLMISLPVVLHFADKATAARVAREVVLGEKRIVLAVTEPFAGSDVAQVRHTAVKSADGSHYVLNGVKKWITGGATADYFVTLSRTGGAGAGGLSYFLVEREHGVETKQLTTSYAKSAGTAYVVYEDVKVPASALIGCVENKGFYQAAQNFTTERLLIVSRIVAATRGTVEECWKWAAQRDVFGKPLLDQPVIRFKLSDCIARLEAVQAWYEAVVNNYQALGYVKGGEVLSGPVCLLKYEATRVASHVAQEAPQIFGGRAITQTGMGKFVERFYRTVKFAAILGGSEEVLAMQAISLAVRGYRGGAKL